MEIKGGLIGTYLAGDRFFIASYCEQEDQLRIYDPETEQRLLSFTNSGDVLQAIGQDFMYIGRIQTGYPKGKENLNQDGKLFFAYEHRNKEIVFTEVKDFQYNPNRYISFEIALAQHLIQEGFIQYGKRTGS